VNDIHDLLGAYCTDALDADERVAFEQHLRACAECRNEAADFREVLAALADAHPVRPPSSLEDAVMAGALPAGRSDSEEPPAPGTSEPTTPADPVPDDPSVAAVTPLVPAWRRAAPWMAAAAAGALLFAGGVGLGRSQAPADSAAPAGDMAGVVAVASAADAHVLPVDIMGTTSRVVMSGEMDKAVFLASELPMPAKGMVYQVWTVAGDGQMASAGSFTPDEDGHVAAVLDCGAAGVDKFMITMEPPGGSEHPSGEMLAEIEA
jgi:anti-sigma-K factor RskA